MPTGGGTGGATVPLIGTDTVTTAENAAYAAAAFSIALDFDDYLCFAHTGHSAVLVPLLMAAEASASGEQQLLAQIVANELEARLGAACLIGPQNGQLWSFVHAFGAAAAAGLLLGLKQNQLAHALGLSLYQAPRATLPGFMAPDSKLITAAEPIASGIRYARLAQAGVTGPLDILDHPQGFFSGFSYTPLREMLKGLGVGWATMTLCIKPYPGCAYLDTMLDAAGEIIASHGSSKTGFVNQVEDIKEIVVEASILTCGMDAMSSRYVSFGLNPSTPPTPVTVSFSVALSMAVLLLAGEITPAQVNSAWLANHLDELNNIARKVKLVHDPDLTAKSIRAFSNLLPVKAFLEAAGAGSVPKGLTSLAFGAWKLRHVSNLSPKEMTGFGVTNIVAHSVDILKDAKQVVKKFVKAGVGNTKRASDTLWNPKALANFAMCFPARVKIELENGQEFVAYREVPKGAAGNLDPLFNTNSVSINKLNSWGPSLWGKAGTKKIARAIEQDDDRLWELLYARNLK